MDVSNTVNEEWLFTWEWVTGETIAGDSQTGGPRRLPSSHRPLGRVRRLQRGRIQENFRMQRNGMYLSLAIQSELGGLGTTVTMFNKGVNERERIKPVSSPNGTLRLSAQSCQCCWPYYSITASRRKTISILVSIFKARSLGWGHWCVGNSWTQSLGFCLGLENLFLSQLSRRAVLTPISLHKRISNCTAKYKSVKLEIK